jgi:coenzyme F420-dependent glucose-6-phosphate dehydrogenase
MITFGYTLSSEEHSPADLVRNARSAEELGFSFASISDHFHPWVRRQGHSPFVWTVLGSIAQATDRLRVGVGVNCPSFRVYPAVVAHASATTALCSGTGSSSDWGPARLSMSTSWALDGRQHRPDWRCSRKPSASSGSSGRGKSWTIRANITRSRMHSCSILRTLLRRSSCPPSNRRQCAWPHGWAMDIGEPHRRGRSSTLIRRKADPALGTVRSTCVGMKMRKQRARPLREVWPNAGLSGQLSQDLPTPKDFEQATETLTIEQVTESIPCGPRVEPILESVAAYVDAGYDHIYFHQIGPNQEGFFRFWTEVLSSELANATPSLGPRTPRGG